jgi:hypothetical protein
VAPCAHQLPAPLLKQGLVVLDTPGLNAIGAEPELTLSLLPTAHATVFILGADTGVTKSDMAIWRDHLGTHNLARFVVLNKIDALVDPLATPSRSTRRSRRSARRRRARSTSAERGVPAVGAPGARRARARRSEALATSRLPRSKRRCRAAAAAAPPGAAAGRRRAAQQVETHVARRLGDQRRQLAEQMLELRGVRGKSAPRCA